MPDYIEQQSPSVHISLHFKLFNKSFPILIIDEKKPFTINLNLFFGPTFLYDLPFYSDIFQCIQWNTHSWNGIFDTWNCIEKQTQTE